MITAQLGQCFHKSIGIVFHRLSRLGQKMRGFNLVHMTSITYVNVRLTVELCTLNWYAKSCPERLSLSCIKVKRSCWTGVNALCDAVLS